MVNKIHANVERVAVPDGISFDPPNRPTRRPRHIHISFSAWTHQSRAWRAGSLALAEGLADRVEYIGPIFSGLPNTEARSENEKIIRMGPEPSAPGSPRFLRAMALPSWWLAVIKNLEVHQSDLIIAHSLAALPVAVALKRRSGAGLLYDAHELETEREGWPSYIRSAAKLVERTLIRTCDHTIVVSKSIMGWYRHTYPGISISTVRNIANICDSGKESTLRADIGVDNDALVIAYVGAIGEGRGLDATIQAFEQVDPQKHLVIIGFGPQIELYKKKTVDQKNIHILSAVPQNELIAYLKGADVGIIVPDGTSLSYWYGLPNKLFEYAAAGLALIVGEGPELRGFVEESGLGWVTSNSADAIARTILPLDRGVVKRRVASTSYAPPTWIDESRSLIAAFRVAAGSTGGDGPTNAAAQKV